jgi:hypothetical protein
MEKNVLPLPEVVRELDKFIAVELYTDRPRAEDDSNQKLLVRLLNTSGLPDYVVLSPDEKLIKAIQGSHSPEEMVAFLKSAQLLSTQVASNDANQVPGK